jgi:SAM-dependent methyltransferase
VSGAPVYRKDLYEGTAEYYDQFRPPYPSALLDDLRVRVPIDGRGRLLDLACGTGQVACALAGDFAEVWAVDQEDEFVEFGRAKTRSSGLRNTLWVTASAEEVKPEGRFDLVTIGNAFHRLRREVVANRLLPHLAPGGCIALLWGDTPDRGDQPWQQAMTDTMRRWKRRVGAQDRVPDNWELLIDQDPHDQVLQRAGYLCEGRFEFSATHHWTVESLIGFVYSTSVLSRAALKDHGEEFETDLRERLGYCNPEGVFDEEASFAYDLARRPTLRLGPKNSGRGRLPRDLVTRRPDGSLQRRDSYHHNQGSPLSRFPEDDE